MNSDLRLDGAEGQVIGGNGLCQLGQAEAAAHALPHRMDGRTDHIVGGCHTQGRAVNMENLVDQILSSRSLRKRAAAGVGTCPFLVIR